MFSGGPRATRALLTSGDSFVAHAGDLSCLTVMMESQANIFFFSFCELAM